MSRPRRRSRRTASTVRGILVLGLAGLAGPVGVSAQAPSRGDPSRPDTLRLATVLERALAVAPELEQARAEAAAAGAARDRAAAERLPTATSSVTVTRFDEPMVVAPLHGFDPTAPPAFDDVIVRGVGAVQWTVWDGGARGGRIEGARAAAGAAEAATASAGQGVLERTVDVYLALLTSRDVLAAQISREAELESERSRVSRFLAEGSAARVELLRAEAELSAARADVAAAGTRAELAAATLARFLALDADTLRDAPAADVELQDVAAPSVVDSDPALDAHPRVAAARRRVEAARAAEAVARAAWLPRIAATGGFNEYGGGSTDFTGEWQAALQVDYPLFTGGARGRAVDEAGARRRAAEAEAETVRRDVALAADRAAATEREARARADALADAVTRFEELARVEALALEEGAGVQRDFLRAQAGLLQARAGLAEARRAVVLARVRLARARGELTLAWIDEHLEGVP